MKSFIAIFLLNLCLYTYSESLTKIWIPNTNYDEPKNWLDEKLPCDFAKIIFPEDLNTAIYLPNNLKVKEIVLPDNGELLIKSDGIMEIQNEENLSCDRKESTFKKVKMEPWLKPWNWKSKILDNLATPHTEKVPCMYDDVIFPERSSFWVQYPEIPISVNSFKIEGKNLTDSELQRFLNSEPGARQFKNLDYQIRTDIINVKNLKCNDKSGCLCHRYSFIEKVVCKNLQKDCNATHCLNSVKPSGHCCHICGAYLNIHFNKNNFDLKTFKNTILTYLSISGYKNIDIHVSKMLMNHDTYIQIVIIEKNFIYEGDSVSAAEDLHNHLITNLNEYNILSSELIISGPQYWPGQKLKTTIGIVLGSLFLVLVTLTVIYFKYESDEGKKWSLPFNIQSLQNFRPFIFVRFENNDNDAGVEFRNRSVASSLFNLDRAFDNPLYDETPSTSQETEENSRKPLQTEYKNPVYSELMKNKEVSDEE